MVETLKELNGHSGSKIFLKKYDSGLLYVEKQGNVERNLERLFLLNYLNYPVPKIYNHGSDKFEMEYIHGLDMKNYLVHNSIKKLAEFIIKTLDSFSKNSGEKNYSEVYLEKLKRFDSHEFSFTKKDFFEKLPIYVPESTYHGDLTLENIIYCKDEFYMIDPVTTPYDSYIFDIAKMRQDIHCKWFLRNEKLNLDVKLKNLEKIILEKYPESKNDALLILMLLRVLDHCEKNDKNYVFLKNNIELIWKNIK
jgi:hypothetical protein